MKKLRGILGLWLIFLALVFTGCGNTEIKYQDAVQKEYQTAAAEAEEDDSPGKVTVA